MVTQVEVFMPALSEDGWVKDPLIKADYIFSHFFASNFSQSQLYTGEVSSMAWVIHQTQGDVIKTITLLTETLVSYFGRYFPNPTVDVKEAIPAGTTADNIKATLSVYVGINIAGKEVSLSKVMELTNSNTFKIINVNNG